MEVTQKYWAVYGGTNKLKYFRSLRKEDVRKYFKGLIRISRIVKGISKTTYRKSGEFCERCGIGVGKRYEEKKVKMWKGFGLCEDCCESKISDEIENTPDLEDLERFNLNKENNYV